ncbi:hypothetical protein B9Z19DRAFT_1089818 [Tuber borchii]|uniref:Uncharacterized protein n=1 Tax=Tuber borchii TaxID=42251 RepID=A0A2T6ZJN7_TUBBO|nr:hypothetical protein B9Z19DRAFT_1089818 [Tuber borchii]
MGVLAEDSLHRGLLYRTMRCVAGYIVPAVTCEGFCAVLVHLKRCFFVAILLTLLLDLLYRYKRRPLRPMVEKENRGREFPGRAGIFRRFFLSLFLEPSRFRDIPVPMPTKRTPSPGRPPTALGQSIVHSKAKMSFSVLGFSLAGGRGLSE